MDLATVQNILARETGTLAQPSQWWLATAGGQVPAGLAGSLPAAATVTSSAGLAAALRDDLVLGRSAATRSWSWSWPPRCWPSPGSA